MSDRMHFEMDPESHWDICPVCMDYLYGLDEFPGRQTMRDHHTEHKSQ